MKGHVTQRTRKRAVQRIVTLICVLLISCTNKEPVQPPYKQSVFLEETYTSVKGAGLHLRMTDVDANTRFILKRDGVDLLAGRIFGPDTTLDDAGLTPGRVYRYQAVKMQNSVRADSSDLLTIRTLDTTDHNYTWTSFSIGKNGTTLEGVAVINDTDIWVVGDIYLYPSGNQPEYTNAVHWNGRTWESRRIESAPNSWRALWSIFAISDKDIWAEMYHYDGTKWTSVKGWMFRSEILHIWGRSSNDVFFLGGSGIAHWNGTSFKELPTGTNYFFRDAYGTPQGDFYACGVKEDDSEGALLRYRNGTWETIIRSQNNIAKKDLFTKYLDGSQMNSVWLDESNTLHVICGGNLLKYKNSSWSYAEEVPENGWRIPLTSRHSLGAIRGLKSNNYFLYNGDGSLMHGNGSSCEKVRLPDLPFSFYYWREVCMKGDIVCAVGNGDNGGFSKGVILIGKKR